MTAGEMEALDRLEQKVQALVSEMERLRTGQAALAQENRRLAGELEAAEARLAEAERSASDADALRRDRDQVRSRVAAILERLEGIDI
jgi:regulator of replication initiation timing